MSGPFQERYSRQILFPGIGEAGQHRLLQSRVVLVGCGATGSALLGLLSRAGVGHLVVIDRDYVEASNLQRQSLFDEDDAAESLPKAVAAARKVAAFNSGIVVEPQVADFVPDNASSLAEGADLLLDGTDNFQTRYLINDLAISRGLPWIYTAAVGSYSVTQTIVPGKTACLACTFPEPPRGAQETCDSVGILNAAVEVASALAAAEAVKLLVGAHQQLRRSLVAFDLWSNQRSEISTAQPRPDCRACQCREFPYLAGERQPHITLCGRNSVQIHERDRPIDLKEMGVRLQPHGRVRHTDFLLKFWFDPYEMTLFPDGRAIIKGTSDPAVARSLYARYVGS